MKKLLYALPGSLIIFSAVFATQFPLAAAEKKQKARPVTIYTQSEFKLSGERMKIIDDILENAIKRNLDFTRESTILLLETEISSKMPLTPKAPVSNKNISQFAAEARKMVRVGMLLIRFDERNEVMPYVQTDAEPLNIP